MMKSKTIYIILPLLLLISFSQAQHWVHRGGGITIDEGMDIASDGANNTYTTGYFTSSATFDNNNITSAGLSDIFIVKNNSSGNLQWLKRAGGLNVDKALSIDADNAGNIVVTGFFMQQPLLMHKQFHQQDSKMFLLQSIIHQVRWFGL